MIPVCTQCNYNMWSKQKHSMSPLQVPTKPVYVDSWEEQAFAEDAAGSLGGCIWPPRSYSCSFCKREFRSAQALGGHMNVHRRDRALLKQSLSPRNEIPQHPSQISSKVFNHKPNSLGFVFASPSPASRVSPPPSRANYAFVPLFSSPIIKEYHKKTSIFSPPPWSNLVADKYFHIADPNDKKKSSKFLGSNIRAKEDCVTADLSASLNLAVCRNRPNSSGGEEECSMSCKKPKTDSSPLQSFLETNSSEGHHLQSEIVELSSSSIEEDLDLELRLGNR